MNNGEFDIKIIDNGKTALINSVLSFSTIDGPGIRSVIFMQGCPFKCCYCHNPETWDFNNGKTYNLTDLMNEIKDYSSYFSNNGGVTVSGGECLFQHEFLVSFLGTCKSNNIHTAIDTSGMLGNLPNRYETKKRVFDLSDLVILDIKFADCYKYSKYTKGDFEELKETLDILEALNKKVWVRQVILSDINDGIDDIKNLKLLITPYKCIEKLEFLPFKNICMVKYENLSMDFPLKDLKETTSETISSIYKYYDSL